MGVRTQARRIVMITLIVVGAVAMFVSTRQDRLWWVLGLFLLGMSCLSLLLLQISDALASYLHRHLVMWWPWSFGGMALFGLLVVALAVSRQLSPFTVIAGMVLFTLGGIGLFLWIGRRQAGLVGRVASGASGPTIAPPGRIGIGSVTWYGFEAMAVGIGLLMISDGTSSLLGALTWIAGLITVKIGSVPYLESRGAAIGRTVRVLVDVALGGLFVLFAGAFTSNLVLLMLGLSVLAPALSMIGIGALHLDCSRNRIQWVTGLSVVAGFGVIGWMTVVTQNPGVAFVLGLLIAIAGSFFVFRGEGIVILMLIGYVLAWGLVDRSVPLPELPDDASVQIVALGDSFISGEGARKFFDDTNDAGGNQCRRAPTSYPYLVAEGLNASVVSFACSGAKIADLSTCGQMWPEGRRCREAEVVAPPIEGEVEESSIDRLVAVWKDALDQHTRSPAGPLPQLVTAETQGVPANVEVVLLSIGGNDVGFSAIVKACLLPKGCEERREVWLNSIDLLGPQLDEVYMNVAAAFPNASVLVVPYPMLVNAEPTSCELGLSSDEREFVVDFIQKLDATIAAAAARAGFVFVEEAITAYDGAQLCDEDAAANHLRLVPTAGDPLGRYSPGMWIPGSMHPNERGHELTAASMVCRVADALAVAPVEGTIAQDRPFACADTALPDDAEGQDGGEDAGGAPPVGDAAEAAACEAALSPDEGATAQEAATCEAVAGVVDRQLAELATEVAVVTDELVSDDEWIRVELFRTVRALALPLVLLLAIGIVFAWGFAQLDNPFSRFLHQDQGIPDGLRERAEQLASDSESAD